MKKEARIQAEKMFLKSAGKLTQREIAKAVNVNALTIGRWKKDDEWDSKLKTVKRAGSKPPSGVVRKKEAQERAFEMYMDAGGNITNKDLAKKVGVTPATVAIWKRLDSWIEQIKEQPLEPEAELAPEPEPASVDESENAVSQALEEQPDLDMGDLAAPEQIIQINQKIGALLQRDYLSAEEVAHLAEAKSDCLEALEIYLAIVREVSALKAGD